MRGIKVFADDIPMTLPDGLYTFSDSLMGKPNVFSIGVDMDYQTDEPQSML